MGFRVRRLIVNFLNLLQKNFSHQGTKTRRRIPTEKFRVVSWRLCGNLFPALGEAGLGLISRNKDGDKGDGTALILFFQGGVTTSMI